LSRWTALVLAAAVLAASLLLTACETTKDKAKKIQAAGAAQLAAASKPLTIPKPSKDVKVVGSTLLHDQYGDAVAVELRNTSNQPQVNFPIIVDVRGANGKTLYKNDLAGLEPNLNHVPLIEPGQTFTWVNDQLNADTPPKSVKVKVGESTGQAPAKLPQIDLNTPKVEADPSGIVAKGVVTNKSQVDQEGLVVFAVARSGGRIVAAGRAVVKKLKVHQKPFNYQLFFIGDPKGAQVEVTAPPTTLQ
jgi:predicted small secreted protein